MCSVHKIKLGPKLYYYYFNFLMCQTQNCKVFEEIGFNTTFEKPIKTLFNVKTMIRGYFKRRTNQHY